MKLSFHPTTNAEYESGKPQLPFFKSSATRMGMGIRTGGNTGIPFWKFWNKNPKFLETLKSAA